MTFNNNVIKSVPYAEDLGNLVGPQVGNKIIEHTQICFSYKA